MLVLIIGASSGIGLSSARQALERGHSVRAFARSAHRIRIEDPQLDKQTGDALEGSDIASALAGVDVVIQALGVPSGPDLLLRPVELFSAATRLLISAMEKARVKRLISVTGFGAGDSNSRLTCLERVPFELVLGRAYRDKGVQEDLIRGSSLDWTIARPVVLTDGPRTGLYEALVSSEQWRNGLISRADVADFLVRQVEDDRYVGQTPVLRTPFSSLLHRWCDERHPSPAAPNGNYM